MHAVLRIASEGVERLLGVAVGQRAEAEVRGESGLFEQTLQVCGLVEHAQDAMRL